MNKSITEVNGDNKRVLIVAFGGSQCFLGQWCMKMPRTIIPFEFMRILTRLFPNYDKKFIVDLNQCWYHKGIEGFTTNISETTDYLEKIISGYEKVVFIGTSSGGYAAILFGSLLNISTVIAFIPQTILTRENLDEKYKNIKNMINDTTTYHVYGDTSFKDKNNIHHISHVENIREFKNVHIVTKHVLSLPAMRDSGELDELFLSLIKGGKAPF